MKLIYKKIILLLLAIGLIMLLIMSGVKLLYGKQLCAYQGGKWAATSRQCFTTSCYQQGDCGSWYAPSAWCNQIKTTDSLAKVYFWLGEPHAKQPYPRYPSHFTGDIYWPSSPADAGIIKVSFSKGQVTTIQCQ